MGAEARCAVTSNGRTVQAEVRLETEVLEIRGPELRLSLAFKRMSKISARDGVLRISSPDGTVSLELGDAAAKWARKIEHPPSRLEKIGVKPAWRASAVGVDDAAFLKELDAAVSSLSVGRVVKDNDAIFVGVTREAQLDRLSRLKTSLKPDGALWVIRPKGRPEISEGAVMAAGKAAGLVDVKVVGFSPTHTAEKFVIPVKARPR